MLVAVCAGASLARAQGAGAHTPEVVPPYDSFTVQSSALRELRRINIHAPKGASSALPVLVMPDGGIDEDFPHVARAVDSLVATGRIRPVLLVGIPNTERRRDLTGPTRIKIDSAIAPHVGGSAAFRAFIRDELIPEITRRYRVTTERSIIGESLAGLFIVETFLREPALFTHYVALDPSVWWNGGALVDEAPTLLRAHDSRERSLFFASTNEKLISVGSAKLDTVLRAAQVRGLRFMYEPHEELTHATIFRALELKALEHALR